MFAAERFRVEAEVVDVCPPRPARIKDYNERSLRTGHRRDAQRTRRVKVSTDVPSPLYSLCLLNKLPICCRIRQRGRQWLSGASSMCLLDAPG